MRSISDDKNEPQKPRTTGLQAAQVARVRLIKGWREQFTPREYATLLDLHGRWLQHEITREERAIERWAA
jgi:hypothetical protein